MRNGRLGRWRGWCLTRFLADWQPLSPPLAGRWVVFVQLWCSPFMERAEEFEELGFARETLMVTFLFIIWCC